MIKTPLTAALYALQVNGPLTAREFAAELWPQSAGWDRVKRGGRGSVRGKGMWLAGGSYLAKLKRAGLVYRSMGDVRKFCLTGEGHRRLIMLMVGERPMEQQLPAAAQPGLPTGDLKEGINGEKKLDT